MSTHQIQAAWDRLVRLGWLDRPTFADGRPLNMALRLSPVPPSSPPPATDRLFDVIVFDVESVCFIQPEAPHFADENSGKTDESKFIACCVGLVIISFLDADRFACSLD